MVKLKPKSSLNEVVDDLVEVTSKILKHKAGVALGDEPSEESHMYNKEEMEKILKLMTPLIQGVQASRQITANTSAEVVNLLAEGKVSAAEALALLKMVKEKVDIEAKEMEHEIKKGILNDD